MSCSWPRDHRPDVPNDFDFSSWIDACNATDGMTIQAWFVVGAFAALGDEHGSITPAAVVSWLETDDPMMGLYDETDPADVPAGRVFAEGCRTLAAANLLLDLDERLVAVLPTIPVYQEDNHA
jgi:hypothetical protein